MLLVLLEGDIGVCGVAVLLSFLCGIPVNKISHCGVAVISNPTVCDVCAFQPTVFGETIICGVATPAVSMQFTCRPCAMDGIYDLICDVFAGLSLPVVNNHCLVNFFLLFKSCGQPCVCSCKISYHMWAFSLFSKSHIGHVNHGNLKIYRGVGVSATFLAVMRCSY